ncbi:MAG: nucleoside triphosphate pyrophosphohydrolase [Thermovirgaceae bacterium]|jgi:XTP/dITP diphosphohydrolase/tetrapyrrole methylase family protein/MazG family protein/ATP diphosphatase|nr:nucleoside triphosphate pyrophosphohydrolase [Synergistales bacterium]MDI9392866.1 nucleoside triphosphate pyrophosphohydrolase [Synergistota bacterium]HRW87396.1 nucleoside triphosphate pyrophosphohydrolase [Thermovirgaceae bacterium]MDD3829765.1 nucleoside triphosphate pyrophosphohydrolase [Synergistales bacterium]MDD5514638.1 nucleoside triphosphate pyrophosphohydrolase [Synergistales bacterium]
MDKGPGVHEQMDRLLSIMKRLREPGGCPWDREQTLKSLRSFILEEAYELVDAIEREEPGSICEECGDLLLQVVFVARICMEEGLFDLADSIKALNDKLKRRHPHVFGEERVENSSAVRKNWDLIKQGERRIGKKDSSLFAGIPPSLPALVKSRQIQDRAAKVGFDWEEGDLKPLMDKVQEEIKELHEAVASCDSDNIEEEIGDTFFALVNLSRHLRVEAEFSLQRANRKFEDRFRFIEDSVERSGRPWSDYSLEELEILWDNAKREKAAGTA